MSEQDKNEKEKDQENDALIDDEKLNKETNNEAADLSKFSTKGLNKCYLLSLLLTISIGTIQFGYMIGSWNSASAAYGKKQGWDEDEQINKVIIIQSLTTAGAAVGALLSGTIAFIGRWKCIMISNTFLVIGAVLCFFQPFYVLCIGRFIYGVSVGAFSVFCPKYIAEVSPIEVKGPAGALTQISITFGILLAFSIGLGIGDVDSDDINSFQIQYYWYILFSVPLFLSLIQILLLVLIFSYDTPVVLKQNGKTEELTEFMSKIYQEEKTVTERIEMIKIEDKKDGQNDESYGVLCCNPKYRRATQVGITLSVFSQLTGINAIMFYSNMIFKGLSLTATFVTALIGIVNFITSIIGLILLVFFGRKILMLLGNAAMAILLLTLAAFSFSHDSIGMIVCVLLFISFFEFSTGPIVWLYTAEIMKDKAMSIATFLNWTLSLAISIAIPFMVKYVSVGYIFLMFGLFTTLGTIYIAIFMRETMGKTQQEIDEMFEIKTEKNKEEQNKQD